MNSKALTHDATLKLLNSVEVGQSTLRNHVNSLTLNLSQYTEEAVVTMNFCMELYDS